MLQVLIMDFLACRRVKGGSVFFYYGAHIFSMWTFPFFYCSSLFEMLLMTFTVSKLDGESWLVPWSNLVFCTRCFPVTPFLLCPFLCVWALNHNPPRIIFSNLQSTLLGYCQCAKHSSPLEFVELWLRLWSTILCCVLVVFIAKFVGTTLSSVPSCRFTELPC